VGDVLLVKRASVHYFDRRSLNAYDTAGMVLNPNRAEAVELRGWWEMKELEIGDFE